MNTKAELEEMLDDAYARMDEAEARKDEDALGRILGEIQEIECGLDDLAEMEVVMAEEDLPLF